MGDDVNAICSFANKSRSQGSTPKLEQPDAKVTAAKTSEYFILFTVQVIFLFLVHIVRFLQ